MKSIHTAIADFCEYHATDQELFIYNTMIGLENVNYDDEYKYVLNYPGKKPTVTRQTFHSHKRKLITKLKTLHERVSQTEVGMV
tara:strand:- start:4463 stop:4714 length:252 start_codon:yes stop_codon:yes gene_type:complete